MPEKRTWSRYSNMTMNRKPLSTLRSDGDLHPSRMLWKEQDRTAVYGLGMSRVPEPIPGRAFFPGGFGLESARKGQPLPRFPTGGVMVLGQDFQTVSRHEECLELGEEPLSDGTWRPLLALLHEASIDPADVFFTNAYMGLRKAEPATGANPDRRHKHYAVWCASFLVRQLEVQRPRVVLVLGKEPLRVLADLSPELRDLRRDMPFSQIDRSAGGPVRQRVTFHGITKWDTRVAVLTHPSFRFANVWRRHFRGMDGHDAELLMLRSVTG